MELSTQLNIHNPVVVKVRGDGNCLTNAISLTDPFRSSREISLLTLKVKSVLNIFQVDKLSKTVLEAIVCKETAVAWPIPIGI